MRPEVQLTGIHSRSETLVSLTRAYDRGLAEWDEVQDRLKLETAQLLDLQATLGFSSLSDGGLGWQDPLRPLSLSLSGVSVGARYSRWFDTNTFYKKPIITGKVGLESFEVDNFVQKTVAPGVRNWKVAIPGPYSFAELSENQFYDSPGELLKDIANVERQIVDKLLESGVSTIQLSEPCLVYSPYRKTPLGSAELDEAVKAVRTTSERDPSKIAVHTFFGDAAPVLPKLLELPVASVGIDLYETEPPTQQISSKKITLGIIDSRESHVEDPAWIAKTARHISQNLKTENLILAPNSDLRYVPREVADQKLQALGRAAKILRVERQ